LGHHPGTGLADRLGELTVFELAQETLRNVGTPADEVEPVGQGFFARAQGAGGAEFIEYFLAGWV